MPSYRKLPSGSWQATVYKPDGTRVTKTDRLKSVVRQWAEDLELRYRRGERLDPRAGEIRVAEWRERVMGARGLERPTLAKGASIWRTHCEPQWGTWPLNAITRAEAQAWANRLRTTRRARHKGRADADEDVPYLSPATVREAVHVMSTLYVIAMSEDPPIVTANPFSKLELPRVQQGPVSFYERGEVGLLLATLERSFSRRWRLLVELGMDVGLRPGELYGLHTDRVDWERNMVAVTRVMTRYGLREYPKSRRSRRTVPVPAATMRALAVELGAGRRWAGECTCPRALPDGSTRRGRGPCPGLVFPAPEGGPISDVNFRGRIWYPAIEAAGIRRFPPRIMRHTAASWLVMDGVPLYHVQHLLGHESYATTQRYAHLAPDAHDRVRESWDRRARTL